jgi:hypothetical protein
MFFKTENPFPVLGYLLVEFGKLIPVLNPSRVLNP